MNTFLNILKNPGTWVVVAMFLISWFLMQGIENSMEKKDTLWPILGFIPAIVIFYFYFVRKRKK